MKKKNETLTIANIDELLQYLPILTKPRRIFVRKWAGGKQADGTMHVPFPIYSKVVEDFFREASQPWWLDHGYNPIDAGKMLSDENLLQNATLYQIRTMLTYCVRGERFCDGFWGDLLKSGRIFALLRRLKIVRNKLRMSPQQKILS